MSLLLARHGESEWNSRHLLTGWSDPPLSSAGEQQARQAGIGLAGSGARIDVVYTSLLGRARATASLLVSAAGAQPARIEADWRLNERHLGLLEGLTKQQVSEKWGNQWRKRWRDDPHAVPPPLSEDDPRHPRFDPRYRHLLARALPGSEKGSETAARVLEFWHERALPALEEGRHVLVVSHLGPLRVLAGHLSSTSTGGLPVDRWANGAVASWRQPLGPCCGTVSPKPGRASCTVP